MLPEFPFAFARGRVGDHLDNLGSAGVYTNQQMSQSRDKLFACKCSTVKCNQIFDSAEKEFRIGPEVGHYLSKGGIWPILVFPEYSRPATTPAAVPCLMNPDLL